MTEIKTASGGRSAAFGGPSRDQPQSRKRVANDYMRDGLRRLGSDRAIPFFCECNQAACFAAVWLTGPAFDHARDGGRGVLVVTHRVAAIAA